MKVVGPALCVVSIGLEVKSIFDVENTDVSKEVEKAQQNFKNMRTMLEGLVTVIENINSYLVEEHDHEQQANNDR